MYSASPGPVSQPERSQSTRVTQITSHETVVELQRHTARAGPPAGSHSTSPWAGCSLSLRSASDARAHTHSQTHCYTHARAACGVHTHARTHTKNPPTARKQSHSIVTSLFQTLSFPNFITTALLNSNQNRSCWRFKCALPISSSLMNDSRFHLLQQ
jgi:hypothetical protein